MKNIHEPSRHQFWFAVTLVVFGCALLLAAFIVDPTGEIHSSVLAAFGEILSFAGAVLGFDYYNRKTYLTITRRHQKPESDEKAPAGEGEEAPGEPTPNN